ncbi:MULTISPECIES: hypothetical protein [Sphingobacterium]|uniref:hypothetical protein n=1 Tax=Sphingobacterium TaxID=28453 RepID=UPI0025796F89|nr:MULTISPECIES: hypothetical protein [Sphingobacterium]
MKVTLNKFVALFCALTILTSSCQKDKQEYSVDSGKGNVKLKVGGTSFTRLADNVSSKASNGIRSTSSAVVQSQEVSFNDEYKVIATLIPVGTSQQASKGALRAESVSNGAVTQPLEKGIKYTVEVFEKGNLNNFRQVKFFTHGVDDSDISFDLPSGEYTLVAYGGDRGKALLDYNNENFFRWQKDIKISEGENLNLNIVFQNTFASANITLNAENIGTIQSIGSLNVTPTYFSIGYNVNYLTGLVKYEGPGRSVNIFSGMKPSSSVWTSDPLVLKSGPNKAEISLYNVVINGIEGHIHLSNLTIEDGVKYDIQLKLGSKTEKTFKIAGLEFAEKNLNYDWDSNTYSFNEGTLYRGGHFFPNYVKPKARGSNTNNKPDPVVNGANGDPCELVQPLNTWRLPTKNEMEILLASNKTILSNFSYFPPSASSKEREGVFFGTESHPADRYKFLFLSLQNYYTNSASTSETPGYAGRYLLKNGANEFAQLALSLYKSEGIISATGEPRIINQVPEDMALSVRCVKK